MDKNQTKRGNSIVMQIIIKEILKIGALEQSKITHQLLRGIVLKN